MQSKSKNIVDSEMLDLPQQTYYNALHPLAAGLRLAGGFLVTSATSTSTFRSGKWLHGAPDH